MKEYNISCPFDWMALGPEDLEPIDYDAPGSTVRETGV